MSNIIDKIQVSGVTYDIGGTGGGGNPTVELTQAEYDALVTAGTVSADTYYIITDAQAGDLTNYYTKTETNTLLGGKQATLVSGTNIKTINNESLLGSGNIDIQGGGSITVDTELSTTSENPVQNKVVTAALNGKGDTLQWDATSTARKDIPLKLLRGLTILSSQALNLGDYLQYGSPTSSALCITGLTPTTDFTTHTADTTVHVTNTEKATWNAKSDFSGDYNDLTNKPTIPTVPTSNTAFTNDAGYITIDAISGKVDTTTYNIYTAATDTALASKQTALTAGTGISIVDNVISATGGGGGGKTIEAGRGISITTGETADTVSFNLPISASTGSLSIAENNDTVASGMWSHAEGAGTSATSYASHAEGKFTLAAGDSSHAEGSNTETKNFAEHASGRYNVSSSASTTFGDSGNTIFSVGNGTAENARHNAFEIRQNGDIYLNNGTNDVKLQEYLQIKAVQISQSDYDQLQTKDPNTLYCIVN